MTQDLVPEFSRANVIPKIACYLVEASLPSESAPNYAYEATSAETDFRIQWTARLGYLLFSWHKASHALASSAILLFAELPCFFHRSLATYGGKSCLELAAAKSGFAFRILVAAAARHETEKQLSYTFEKEKILHLTDRLTKAKQELHKTTCVCNEVLLAHVTLVNEMENQYYIGSGQGVDGVQDLGDEGLPASGRYSSDHGESQVASSSDHQSSARTKESLPSSVQRKDGEHESAFHQSTSRSIEVDPSTGRKRSVDSPEPNAHRAANLSPHTGQEDSGSDDDSDGDTFSDSSQSNDSKEQSFVSGLDDVTPAPSPSPHEELAGLQSGLNAGEATKRSMPMKRKPVRRVPQFIQKLQPWFLGKVGLRAWSIRPRVWRPRFLSSKKSLNIVPNPDELLNHVAIASDRNPLLLQQEETEIQPAAESTESTELEKETDLSQRAQEMKAVKPDAATPDAEKAEEVASGNHEDTVSQKQDLTTVDFLQGDGKPRGLVRGSEKEDRGEKDKDLQTAASEQDALLNALQPSNALSESASEEELESPSSESSSDASVDMNESPIKVVQDNKPLHTHHDHEDYQSAVDEVSSPNDGTNRKRERSVMSGDSPRSNNSFTTPDDTGSSSSDEDSDEDSQPLKQNSLSHEQTSRKGETQEVEVLRANSSASIHSR